MNIIKISFLLTISMVISIVVSAQDYRWQQRVNYKMDIEFDTPNHQYTGHQVLKYKNNSPDTLNKVFYYLFFNAFQPGSMMDVRSRSIMDPDKRVGDRILGLSKEEIGFIDIKDLSCNNNPVSFMVEGTILEVTLENPILPGKTATFEMNYLAQVPLQIRRSGRDNKEGIDYSMTQWYPKMCEYDEQGWHANPYIGREFNGVWGDYDVNITMPSEYIIGGTGVLINADEIGYGYSDKVVNHTNDRLTWHFIADNVHDFAFAADPDYKHTKIISENGTILHYLYQENEETKSWELLPEIMKEALTFMNNRYGMYAYPCYTVIQGGDGGMEYPMTTLIRGNRSLRSLVGVSIHEWMHSWYQMMLATNESLYSWMDEGFTSFAETEVIEYIKSKELLDEPIHEFPWENTYNGYRKYIVSDYAEPCSTHSDHYNTNYAYGVNSYYLGNIFLKQLEYIIGEKAFTKGIKNYYNKWKFKHPKPNDFMRIMERSSDLELDWYKEYWINTTKTIDYGIDTLIETKGKTHVLLKKIGLHPMPLDITVSLKNGKEIKYNIPLRIMRGNKSLLGAILLPDWPWTNANYEFIIDEKLKNIDMVTIDPSRRLADLRMNNNVWPKEIEEQDKE